MRERKCVVLPCGAKVERWPDEPNGCMRFKITDEHTFFSTDGQRFKEGVLHVRPGNLDQLIELFESIKKESSSIPDSDRHVIDITDLPSYVRDEICQLVDSVTWSHPETE